MAVKAVRGAVQIDKNEKSSIEDGVIRLVKRIVEINSLDNNKIISIIFSQTADLNTMNPATALRKSGFSRTPLFCTMEPDIIGSMERVIRVLITTEAEVELKPVYLDGARLLRKDLDN